MQKQASTVSVFRHAPVSRSTPWHIKFLVALFSLAFLWSSHWAFAQPALRVEQVSRGYRMSWPATAGDFVLQGAPVLEPKGWQDIPDSPEVIDDEFVVIINFDSPENFYRLVNRPLPVRLPTLKPAGETAFSSQQLASLLGELKIDPQQAKADPRGFIFFLDPERFQSIPSLPVTDPEILKQLQEGNEEQESPSLFQSFDFEKLKKHQPMPRKSAVQATLASLKASRMLPPETRAVPSHTRLSLVDHKGQPLLPEVLLDTQVNLGLYHEGIPLTGPGAQIGISFDPEGNVSQFLFSSRPLEPGPEVPILDERTAIARCASLFPKEARIFKPRLMYYVPSVLEAPATSILPCYECAAAAAQEGGEMNLVRRMISATEDGQLLPAVQLEAQLKDRTVIARALVTGGAAPFRYQWLSTSTDLSGIPDDQSAIDYAAAPSERGPERLIVLVTDANGIEASAVADLGTPAFGPLADLGQGIQPAASVTDFGVERAVSDLGSGIQSGFVNRFKQSAFLRFNWSGVSSYERDFRQGGTGLDHLYVDNVDLTLYIGHGSPGGFTFESAQTDGSIVPNDVIGAWGNLDQEWMCLVSCQVLKWLSGGKNVTERWGPAFDRLHMLLGFDTNAYDWSGFGANFANWTLGYNVGFFQLPPMPIRHSWFLAKRQQQPAEVVAGAMGPIGPGGVSNCNEYFWGKGPTGPDISKSNIQGWWVLYYQ